MLRIKTSDLFFSSFQAAQIVLISLFELNTPEFTMLLGALPKTFQDGATKLLHNHLKNSSNTSVVRAHVIANSRALKLPDKLLQMFSSINYP